MQKTRSDSTKPSWRTTRTSLVTFVKTGDLNLNLLNSIRVWTLFQCKLHCKNSEFWYKKTGFSVRPSLSELSHSYSTISKYSWGLLNHQIWRSNSIWKWSNQTSFFSELQLNLFGVFITKGDQIDFPHLVSLFSPNFDHQIFELEKYFSKRSSIPSTLVQGLCALWFWSPNSPGNISNHRCKPCLVSVVKCEKS